MKTLLEQAKQILLETEEVDYHEHGVISSEPSQSEHGKIDVVVKHHLEDEEGGLGAVGTFEPSQVKNKMNKVRAAMDLHGEDYDSMFDSLHKHGFIRVY